MVVRYLCALVILALTANSCTNGDEECLVSKTKNVARTDCMSEIEEVAGEVEGVSDADAIVHLQMRAVVDIPHGHAAKSQESPKDLDRHSQTANIVLEQEPSAKEDVRKAAPVDAVQHKLVVSLMQVYTQSAPFLQMATVLGVLAIALMLRKLVNFIEQTAMKSNAKLDPFDASAKLQQLLQALRFEPPAEDETQPWTKEMQPPVFDGMDSVQTVEQMKEEQTEHTPLEAEDEPEGEASVDHAEIALAGPDKQPATYKREQKKQGLTLALQKSGLSIALEEQPSVKPKMLERTERVALKAQVLSC